MRLTLEDGRFIRRQDVVRIDNDNVEKGDVTSFTYQLFTKPGNYHFTVETTIKGEYDSYARDTSYVTVNS